MLATLLTNDQQETNAENHHHSTHWYILHLHRGKHLHTEQTGVRLMGAKFPLKGFDSLLKIISCETRGTAQALVPSFSAAWLSLAVVPWVMRVGGASDTSRWLPCLELPSI